MGGVLPTIKSDFEPTDSNIDDFTAMKKENDDADKKSERSFAEEVEKEISYQEFRAKKGEKQDSMGSRASDGNGGQSRGRPKDIDNIHV